MSDDIRHPTRLPCGADDSIFKLGSLPIVSIDILLRWKMKVQKMTPAVLLVLMAGFGAASAALAADVAVLRAQATAVFGPLPEAMPGAAGDTSERRALGERLYFDPILSLDRSQSCNTCHRLDAGRGGVDNEATSLGVKGERGGRNAPTVLNAGFQIAQFWDGRAANLTEQAKGPVLNPVEMAMPDEAAVLARLAADAEYPAAFSAAFPNDDAALSYHNMAEAIAAFERTLRSDDRFDDFLGGDDTALTSAELQGLETFINTGCTACHNGPLFGGNSYQKLGLVEPYTASTDPGREALTGNPADRGFFKVPMLRNVALTAPYFHDGKVATLEEAITLMARHQLGRELAQDEIASIAAFLRSLSDTKRGL